MVNDAESHAGEAHRLRELADARNAGEALAYQTERTLAEHRDKLEEADAATIEGRIMELRQAVEGLASPTSGRRRTRSRRRPALSDAVYAQASRRRPQPSGNGGAEDEVVEDADFEVIDEEEATKLVTTRKDAAEEVAEPTPPDPTRTRRAVVELEAERDEYLALAQRVQADFENYRKRAVRDQERLVAHAHERLVRSFPILDDLERRSRPPSATRRPCSSKASSSSSVSCATRSRRRASRDRDGRRLRPARARGDAHPAGRGAEPGAVLEVVQRGYRIGDKVVRPARVIVAE